MKYLLRMTQKNDISDCKLIKEFHTFHGLQESGSIFRKVKNSPILIFIESIKTNI